MKVAVIHEWLVVEAGAEKVLSEILAIFPQADLFCLLDFLPDGKREFIGNRTTRTSFIQQLPFARERYRLYLPLMPLAVEQFDLSDYDLIISSNYAVAKGIITGPSQLHISYVHSPIRYAWDLQFQYLREAGLERGLKSWLARWVLHKMRIWDNRTAHGVDHFIANSKFIAGRIKKFYGRESTIIHPPVDTSFFTPDDSDQREDFYLTVSRMVPYKRIDLLIDAFKRMPNRRLLIIGEGPDAGKLRRRAGAAHNIELLGHLDRNNMRSRMRRARAFLFAAEEDFGIVPLEAQACGTPVIAYGRGGVTETIIDASRIPGASPTGIFFTKQDTICVIDAIKLFESKEREFSSHACRENALRFTSSIFRENFERFISEKIREFSKNTST